MLLKLFMAAAMAAASAPSLAQTVPPKPKPKPVKAAPPLTGGAFKVDSREIADARWRRDREPVELKLGEGLLSNNMRWRLGKEDPKPESETPDPYFNRGN